MRGSAQLIIIHLRRSRFLGPVIEEYRHTERIRVALFSPPSQISRSLFRALITRVFKLLSIMAAVNYGFSHLFFFFNFIAPNRGKFTVVTNVSYEYTFPVNLADRESRRNSQRRHWVLKIYSTFNNKVSIIQKSSYREEMSLMRIINLPTSSQSRLSLAISVLWNLKDVLARSKDRVGRMSGDRPAPHVVIEHPSGCPRGL